MSSDLSGIVRRIDYEAGPTGTPVTGDQLLYLDWTTKTLKRTDAAAVGGGGGPKVAWEFEEGDAAIVYSVGTIDFDSGDASS